MGSRLRKKVNKWVWEFLEGLTLDEPMPTEWFVGVLESHWDSIKASQRHIANRYWECTPQGLPPILRQSGYRVVGHDSALKQSLWFKQSS